MSDQKVLKILNVPAKHLKSIVQSYRSLGAVVVSTPEKCVINMYRVCIEWP